MFFFAHLLAGLIIGKLSGSYLVALIGALFVDLDHLIIYIKHKIILKPKKLWRIIINHRDPYGFQRNFLHSFISWAIISVIILIINFNLGAVFSLAYLTHLLFDLVDNADFYPFYPFKWNVKGPIKYFSKGEMIFTLILLAIFVLI